MAYSNRQNYFIPKLLVEDREVVNNKELSVIKPLKVYYKKGGKLEKDCTGAK